MIRRHGIAEDYINVGQYNAQIFVAVSALKLEMLVGGGPPVPRGEPLGGGYTRLACVPTDTYPAPVTDATGYQAAIGTEKLQVVLVPKVSPGYFQV